MRVEQLKKHLKMEEFSFYRDNVAKLYRHFDDYKQQARNFMCPLPFEVKYELSTKKGGKPFQTIWMVKSPVCIGALFLAWQHYPELFRVTTSEGKTGMIFSFNGSPLSGSNTWSAVDTETGEIFSGTGAPSFMDRCQCLNEAVLQSEEMAEEYRKRKQLPDFVPATLEELVAYVEGLEK